MWVAIVQNFMETHGGYTLDEVLQEDFASILELLRMKSKIEEEAEERAEQERKAEKSGMPSGAARGMNP